MPNKKIIVYDKLENCVCVKEWERENETKEMTMKEKEIYLRNKIMENVIRSERKTFFGVQHALKVIQNNFLISTAATA
jgi:hypothetical protein